MSFIKRGLLYIRRKKIRVAVLFTILFSITSLLTVAISIKNGTMVQGKEVESTATNYFSVKDTSYEPFHITKEMVEELNNINGVEKVVPKRMFFSEIEGISPIGSSVDQEATNPRDFAYHETYYMSDTSTDSRFTTNSLRLVDGKHIFSKNKNSILLSKDLADRNNLHVGDKIKIYYTQKSFFEKQKVPEAQRSEVEILGLFEGQSTSNDQMFTPARIENLLFIDISAAEQAFKPNEVNFDTVLIYTKNSASLVDVQNQTKVILSEPYFEMTENDSGYQKVQAPLDTLYGLVDQLILILIGSNALILVLLLLLWFRSRIHEIAVLMASGFGKVNIISQFLFECFVIGVLALSTGCFAGVTISQTLSDQLVENVNSQENERQSDTEAIFNDLDRTISGEIKGYTVNTSSKTLITVCVMQIAVVVMSVLIGSIPILRLKPKNILSKMG